MVLSGLVFLLGIQGIPYAWTLVSTTTMAIIHGALWNTLHADSHGLAKLDFADGMPVMRSLPRNNAFTDWVVRNHSVHHLLRGVLPLPPAPSQRQRVGVVVPRSRAIPCAKPSRPITQLISARVDAWRRWAISISFVPGGTMCLVSKRARSSLLSPKRVKGCPGVYRVQCFSTRTH